VLIYQLDAATGAPTLVDSLIVAPDVAAILDVEATPDGRILMVSAGTFSGAGDTGLFFYSLADPRHPQLIGRYLVPDFESIDVHTGGFAEINGTLYAVAAQDPMRQKFMLFDMAPLTTLLDAQGVRAGPGAPGQRLFSRRMSG
jgi:hypothetical protein